MKTWNQTGKIGLGGIIAIVILCIVILGGASFYSFLNTLRNQSVDYENRLNAQYLANQAYLSAFVAGFYEQMGVAGMKSDKMDKILMDAVKGRYEQQGGFKNPEGAFFSAIKEAYPDVSGLNIYDKIIDYVSSKREGYRADQEKLLDMLRSYDSWRQKGIVQSFMVESVLHIPSNRLEARIGDNVTRSLAARDQMYRIVLTEGIAEAYQTGKMKPLMGAPTTK